MVSNRVPTSALVGVYLLAAIAANLAIAAFGPSAAIVVAFLFVGLDLVARDALHDRWHGSGLAIRMTGLIAAGGALSFVVNGAAGPIAVASTVAFAAAAVTDALVYRALWTRSWYWRANGSNVPSAAVDSIVFPVLAFGFPVLWGIVVGQFVAKLAGGLLWSFVLGRWFATPRYLVGERGPELVVVAPELDPPLR